MAKSVFSNAQNDYINSNCITVSDICYFVT